MSEDEEVLVEFTEVDDAESYTRLPTMRLNNSTNKRPT
jgi:hypothetical protein